MSDDVETTNDDEVVAEVVDEVVAEVVDERSDAERERDEYLDALQRLQADFENYRKRVARSSDDAATRAAGDLVVRLLPALDAFDLAVAHFGAVGSDELDALTQTRGLVLDVLTREGLERIDAAQVAFDPQVHDAVAHVEGESDGHQIVDEVLRAGYRWRGAVLRPAMVRVKG
ncbi:MAG TPA: nucleotide exchange factor GrpE [Acidimicrobiales bacterium]|nr:MAG: nucleotide exchange factor GrpE [Actinobacteria bacterium 21-64-8]HQT99073.1 nucleotide exchange factor GrpE [Acidimicrobiales bacterium]